MDEQHFTLTVNAAVAVIQTIDGGVVLIVRAQRLQGERRFFAAQLWEQGGRQRGGAELGLAARRGEAQFGGGIAQIETAGLVAAPVEILETGNGGGDVIADQRIVVGQFQPIQLLGAQHCVGDAADDRCLRTLGLRQRLADAFRGMHHAERILDRNVLRAAGLHVQFGAAERWQDQRVFAGHQMAAVKLGADMHRQVAVAQGAGGALGVRRRGGQVAAQRDQHFYFAAQHRFDRFHRVVPQRPVGGEVKVALQAVEQRLGGLLVDPHGAVALDVAVAAYRAQTGARFAQLPEQQLQVGDFTHRRNRVLMLSHAHRPGADHPLGALIGGRRLAQLCFAQARLRGNGLPLGGVHLRQVSLYADAVLFDKRQVEQGGFTGGQALTVGFQQGFHHAAHCRHIAAQIRLVIGRADRRGFWRQHLYRILRIGEPFQPALAQGVEADDTRAASGGVFQAVQHARVVGAGVLAKHEDSVGLFEVIDADGALADADALLQPDAARLVAHIGAVGEVAGAEHAAEQLIKV
ncbi:Uncharacterised protein [Klebsiella oxytoca]|nr:Uncharacterised protein [Klebsiella oxytoca]